MACVAYRRTGALKVEGKCKLPGRFRCLRLTRPRESCQSIDRPSRGRPWRHGDHSFAKEERDLLALHLGDIPSYPYSFLSSSSPSYFLHQLCVLTVAPFGAFVDTDTVPYLFSGSDTQAAPLLHNLRAIDGICTT